MVKRKRVAILISGRGSNMEALLAAAAMPDFPARIVVVISNRPDATGLIKAQSAGVETLVIDHKAFTGRPAFEDALHQALIARDIELICNAGFMRLLTEGFVARWRDRQLNIHPSLLPAFKGLDTHQRALAAGVKLSGCTVHFVRTEMDAGPIIAQAAVRVGENDTAETLATRILAAEHQLYPLALRLVASNRAQVSGERVIVADAESPADPPLISPDH